MSQSEYDRGYHDGYTACKNKVISLFMEEHREERAEAKRNTQKEKEFLGTNAAGWRYLLMCAFFGLAFVIVLASALYSR